jgi:prepilin signal peptidase PulO-like enzyme (type II secretory pathway)
VTLILSHKKQWQSRIPYGPYLALAAVVWILWGSDWWAAYMAWLYQGTV